MNFLFYKKNLLKKQMLFFIVATTLFHFFSISLVLLLNMENPRFFTFLDLMKSSILLLLILVYKGVSFYTKKISGDILASSLTVSYLFSNTSTFILTKCYWQSNTWKCWEIQQENYVLIKSNFYIEHVFFSLYSMVSSYDSSIRPLFSYPLKKLRKMQQKAII